MPAAKLSRSAYGLPVLVAEPQPAPDARIRLGYVGSLVWHKGVHVLLAACARLPPDRYTLEIHGDERTHADYAGLLRRLARGLPVRFCGPFDEAGRAGVYGGLDALVVPSRWPENSPLVIHEARQAGIPVIGARAGGSPS